MMTPRPILTVHAEDVDLEIPGVLAIRASFLSEGLFDERAGGDPEEEDLYEVEVTHAGDALLEPITFPRLLPSSPAGWEAGGEERGVDDAGLRLPMERFALALGWELAQADPSNWARICDLARGWDSWGIDDALAQLPPGWTPEELTPDADLM